MIGAAAIINSVLNNRCLISQETLSPGEILVSQRAVPALYDQHTDSAHDSVLGQIVASTLRFGYERLFTDQVAQIALRRFWARLLDRASLDSASRERVLHAYLYLFADHLADGNADEHFSYDEAYIPQVRATWDDDSNFCTRLVKRVNALAPVDILARDGTNLLLIEVKYGDVDDRAVGQILRYFESIRFLANTVDHLCDLRTTIPVIVASSFPAPQWACLPSSFRELLRVYLYRIENDALVLRDGRRGLQSQLRNDKRYRF